MSWDSEGAEVGSLERASEPGAGIDLEAIKARYTASQPLTHGDVGTLLILVSAQTADLARLAAEIDRLREREAEADRLVSAVRTTRVALKPHTERVQREILSGCFDGLSDAMSDSGLGDLIDAERAALEALADHHLSRLEQK